MPHSSTSRRRRDRSRRIRIGVALAAALTLVGGVSYAAIEHADQPVNTHVNVGAAPFPKPRPLVDALGDSYTEGAGQDKIGDGYIWKAAAALGWQVRNLAEGGTGYLSDGPQNVTGPRHRLGYFIPQVIADKPSVVVVAAGINDSGHVTAALRRTITVDLTRVRRGLPRARIVVIGPWWPNGDPVPGVVTVDGWEHAAAQSIGAVFIDPIRERWITGVWDVPSSGNAHTMIGADRTHPTQAGHNYLARRVVAELRHLGIT